MSKMMEQMVVLILTPVSLYGSTSNRRDQVGTVGEVEDLKEYVTLSDIGDGEAGDMGALAAHSE